MKTLGDIAELTFGFAFKSSQFTENQDDIPLLRGENIGQGRVKWGNVKRLPSSEAQNYRKYLLEKNDVVLAMDGMLVQAGLKYAVINEADSPSLLVQRVARIRANANSDQVFLGYLIGSRAFSDYVRSVQTGSVVPHISGSQISNFPLEMLPNLEKQISIGQLLRSLDDQIESNERISRTALSLAREHVKNAIGSKRLVNLSTSIEVVMGAAFKGTHFALPGVGRPLLRIRDLKTYVPQTWTTESRKDETIIRPGDIVVGMDAEFRATFWRGNEALLNQRVCTFRGIKNVSKAFVLTVIEPELSKLENAKSGTTVIHLNKTDIAEFEVPFLTFEEHEQLSLKTDPLVQLAVSKSKQTEILSKLKEALLPALINGEISTKTLKIHISAESH